MEKLRSFISMSLVHYLYCVNSPSHPIEERQNLLKETPTRSFSTMSSSGMDATDGKEVVVKANIRETPKTHRETELSSSSSSSKTQLSNNVSTYESIQNKVYRDSSYDFSNDAAMKRMRDNIKDFNFVTESPFSWSSPLSRVEESPNHGVLTSREVRVSFNRNLASNGSIRRRSNLSTGSGLKDEVVLSTSSSFWRKSHLLVATRTKSRLMDPPKQRSQKITIKFGILEMGEGF